MIPYGSKSEIYVSESCLVVGWGRVGGARQKKIGRVKICNETGRASQRSHQEYLFKHSFVDYSGELNASYLYNTFDFADYSGELKSYLYNTFDFFTNYS